MYSVNIKLLNHLSFGQFSINIGWSIRNQLQWFRQDNYSLSQRTNSRMRVYWQGTSPLHSENPQGLAIYSVYSYREEELSMPRNGCMERWKEKMIFALFKFSIALQIVCLLPLSVTEEDVSKSPTMWICPFLLLILSYIFGGNVSSWYKYVLLIISS